MCVCVFVCALVVFHVCVRVCMYTFIVAKQSLVYDYLSGVGGPQMSCIYEYISMYIHQGILQKSCILYVVHLLFYIKCNRMYVFEQNAMYIVF